MQAVPTTVNARVFSLHAHLSSAEQRAVFAPVSCWKVIIATNVAEIRLLTIARIQVRNSRESS